MIPQEKGSPHRRGKLSNRAPPAVLPCEIAFFFFEPILQTAHTNGGSRQPRTVRDGGSQRPRTVSGTAQQALRSVATSCCEAVASVEAKRCQRYKKDAGAAQDTGGCQSKGLFSGHTLTSVLKNHKRSKDRRVRYCICHFEASWEVPSQRDNISASSLATPGT